MDKCKPLLYGTDGCHLCDDLEEQLKEASIDYHYIEIADDPKLVEKWGWSIPVLHIDGVDYPSPIDLDSLILILKTDSSK